MFNRTISFLLLFFLLLYLLFPTHNSTIDGFSYAASIKYGEELFSPHHLLFNATGFLLIKFINMFGCFPDVLVFMKGVNAFAAVICLWLLFLTLKELGREKREIILLVLLCGSSFSVWRFATENEVYIIPIILSLAASLFFLRFTKSGSKNMLFFTGLFAAFACLYHQIHFFWWMGLLLGIVFFYKNIKLFVIYVLPAFLIPLAYLVAIVCVQNQALTLENYIRFVFYEFYSGGVDTTFDSNNILLFLINFFRTFIQMHGIIFLLVKKNILFIIPALVVFGLVVLSCLQKMLVKISKLSNQNLFIQTHIFIFVLQLLCALFSVGNAEFMVMIPFLLFMILPFYLFVNQTTLRYVGFSMLVWNFCYGIFPNFYFEFYNNQAVIQKVLDNSQDLYILKESRQIQNEIFYLTGKEASNIQKAPSILVFKNKSVNETKDQIKYYLNKGKNVYTDCLKRPKLINRALFVEDGDIDHEFFSAYNLTKVDSIDIFIGSNYFYKVEN